MRKGAAPGWLGHAAPLPAAAPNTTKPAAHENHPWSVPHAIIDTINTNHTKGTNDNGIRTPLRDGHPSPVLPLRRATARKLHRHALPRLRQPPPGHRLTQTVVSAPRYY